MGAFLRLITGDRTPDSGESSYEYEATLTPAVSRAGEGRMKASIKK
jgi:hypothetical protein